MVKAQKVKAFLIFQQSRLLRVELQPHLGELPFYPHQGSAYVFFRPALNDEVVSELG